MATESLHERLYRLVAEAVRAGRFESHTDFLKQAGLSSGYFGEQRSRAERNAGGAKGDSSMRIDTAQGLAKLLGMTLSQFIGESEGPPIVDIHEGRAWAVNAARNLRFPEAAIQVVLAESRSDDPGMMYWFRRIEAESERIRPASHL